MTDTQKCYIAIDLKSFYASVECTERGLDPLTTHLVVADERRTDKTICLAVSPSLKSYGIPGRARLFEVVEAMRRVNRERKRLAPGRILTGSSSNQEELKAHPELEASYVIARPRMAYYMYYSSLIYRIYRKYIDEKDIHVYSIDEVFIDATEYLKNYGMTGRELAITMIRDVLGQTRITATAGIGTNLYLSKIAMDVVAKHIPPDADGVRIAELDEMSYRRQMWSHTPLTDLWRVGRGTARKLEKLGLRTMGDVARCSLGGPKDALNEDTLYDIFGVNAELLIDHAWGWEPCTIRDIKEYRPQENSLSNSQVLQEPYPYDKALLILREMADQMALSLVEKGKVCSSIGLVVNYDAQNLANAGIYKGEIAADFYGRSVPKNANGTRPLNEATSSSRAITAAAVELFQRTVDPKLLIRRLTISAQHVEDEQEALKRQEEAPQQLSMLDDPRETEKKQASLEEARQREKRRQQAVLAIKKRYGKNAILRGMSFEEGATARERNEQIGGHNA